MPSIGPSVFDVDKLVYMSLILEIIVIPIGFVLNAISLGVFCYSNLGRTSTGHFLIALSIGDCMILVGEGLSLIVRTNHQGFILPLECVKALDAYCQILFYFRYTGRMISSWMTVTITFERFLTIAYPLHVAIMSTPKRAKIIVSVMSQR